MYPMCLRKVGLVLVAVLGALVGMIPTTAAHAAGKPLPAQLAFDASTYTYDDVTVGQTGSHAFTLSNPGGKGASSVSVSVTGAGMSISANACGKSLKPQGTCTVTVAFTPEGTGTVSGTLTASARGTTSATVALTATGVPVVAPRYLYWGSSDIGRAQLNGTSPNASFVLSPGTPNALDVGAGYIYWYSNSGAILRIPVAGTGDPETVMDLPDECWGLVVAAPYLYWANYSTKEIWRSGLDGSNAQVLLTGLDNPTGLDVDGGYVYWSEYSGASTSKIRRVSLTDLTATPDILYEYSASSTRGPAGLEVGAGRVYWAETDWNDYSGSVLSVPVDGGTARVEVAGSNRIDDIALDVDGGWLYYTANNDADSGNSAIARRRLDGTGDVQTLVSPVQLVYSLAIG